MITRLITPGRFNMRLSVAFHDGLDPGLVGTLNHELDKSFVYGFGERFRHQLHANIRAVDASCNRRTNDEYA